MSVDTHTKGRNLAAYQRVRDPNIDVYLSPVLYGMVSRMRIETTGRFLKKLTVVLVGDQPEPELEAGCDC